MALAGRRRVEEALEDAVRRGVAVVVAPAGFGKTFVIEQAFGDIGTPIDMPEGSGIEGLARAIVQAVAPNAERALAQILQRQASEERDAHLTRWMCERLRAIDTPLLLDDFHRIDDDPATRAFIVRVIEATVPQTRWIIAARAQPDLPLGTWIARGWTTLGISASTLAFTTEEAQELADEMGVAIAPSDVRAIVEDVEGWPLAVRLLLDAWKTAPALPPVRIRTRDVLFNFIEQQIWAPRSLGDRRLLLAAALVADVRPEIFEAAGFDNALRDFSDLARRVPLLQRTAQHRFRIHELFRDFIIERHNDAVLHRQLIEQLVRGYESLGYLAEALVLASHGRAHETTVELLARFGVELIETGQRGVVARALAALPPSYGRINAVCIAIRGYLRAAEGSDPTAESDLRSADRTAMPRTLSALVAIKLGVLALNRGDPAACLEDLTPYLEDADKNTRAEALVLSAGAHSMLERKAESRQLLNAAYPLLESVPTDVRARLHVRIAGTQRYLREYTLAEHHATLGAELARTIEATMTLRTAYATLYSIANRVYADLSIASRYAEQWLRTSRDGDDRAGYAKALAVNIGLCAERGDDERYKTHLSELRRLHFPLSPDWDLPLRWAQVLVDVGHGRLREAATLMSSASPLNDGFGSRIFIQSLAGLLWAIAGDAAQAEPLLATRDLHLADARSEYAYYAPVYRSLGWWVLGKSKQAQRTFRSPPEGVQERDVTIISVIRSICTSNHALIDHNKMELLTAPLVALDLHGQARFLRAAFVPRSTATLTRTELEVLRQFRTPGITMAEVADRLGRSPRTVETHIQNACAKFGCESRAAAIAHAFNQGWID